MSTQKKQSHYYSVKEQTSKTMPQLREGDWICITCSNLNFSFRTVCNRCKIQTKDSNFHQFYNYIMHVHQFIPAIDQHLQIQKASNYIFEQNKENKPFQSALLLTPTKNDNNDETDEPYKSPRSLPSVSPLLKKYNSLQLVQYSTQTSNTNSLRKPLATKFQLDPQIYQVSQNEKDQQMNSQIFLLLSQLNMDF